jgi:hypothetical protein
MIDVETSALESFTLWQGDSLFIDSHSMPFTPRNYFDTVNRPLYYLGANFETAFPGQPSKASYMGPISNSRRRRSAHHSTEIISGSVFIAFLRCRTDRHVRPPTTSLVSSQRSL